MTLLSSNEVRALKRPALQALAKKHGIKANTKNVEMVEELLQMFPDGVPTERVVVESASLPPSPVRAARAPSPSLGPEPHAHALPTPAPPLPVFYAPTQAPQVAAPANSGPPESISQMDGPVAAPANLASVEAISQAYPSTSGQALQLGAQGSFSRNSARSRFALSQRSRSFSASPHQRQLVNNGNLYRGTVIERTQEDLDIIRQMFGSSPARQGEDDDEEDTGYGQPQEEPVQEEQDVVVETIEDPEPQEAHHEVGDNYMETLAMRMRAVSATHNQEYIRLHALMEEAQRILKKATNLGDEVRQEEFPMYRKALHRDYGQFDVRSFPNVAVYGGYVDTGVYEDGQERETFPAAAGTKAGRKVAPVKEEKKLAADVYRVNVVERGSKRSRDDADDFEEDESPKRARLAFEGLKHVVHAVGSSHASAISDFSDSIPPQSRRQSNNRAREWSSLPPSSPPPQTSSSRGDSSRERYTATQKGKGRAR